MSGNAQLIESVRDALASSLSIKSWCQETYGADHTVYVGVDTDSDDPVPDGDYPAVVIVGWKSGRGNSTPTSSVQARIACGVIQETVEEDGNKKTYKGMLEAEAFMELVFAALKTGFGHVECDGEAGMVSAYPYFENYNDFTITNVNRRRRL